MQQLDTVHMFETPEGVDLGLRVAGPVSRALAWAIDTLIRYAVLFLLSSFLGYLDALGVGLFLILLFLAEWFYPVVFEVTRGATPGKKAMGLLVVHDNGTPVGWSASMIRNLLRGVDFLPLFYGVGLMSVLLNNRFKRLGDLAAGTLVVYAEKKKEERSEAIQTEALVIPVALSVEEQRALLDFAERHHSISPGRSEELAEFITEERGSQAVAKVLSYAGWIAKGK